MFCRGASIQLRFSASQIRLERIEREKRAHGSFSWREDELNCGQTWAASNGRTFRGDSQMRFEYYHSGLDDVRKLSVDGTVSNSIHFSHWEGNRTPAEVKADTSTEIALNLVGSPERERLTEGVELV